MTRAAITEDNGFDERCPAQIIDVIHRGSGLYKCPHNLSVTQVCGMPGIPRPGLRREPRTIFANFRLMSLRFTTASYLTNLYEILHIFMTGSLANFDLLVSLRAS